MVYPAYRITPRITTNNPWNNLLLKQIFNDMQQKQVSEIQKYMIASSLDYLNHFSLKEIRKSPAVSLDFFTLANQSSKRSGFLNIIEWKCLLLQIPAFAFKIISVLVPL